MSANAIIWALDENPNLAGTTLAWRNTAGGLFVPNIMLI